MTDPSNDQRPNRSATQQEPAHQASAARRFRRRLLCVAIGLVVAWMATVTIITGVANGYWGDLGLPTDAEGRPRGLLVIGAATIVAGAIVAVTYRRVSAAVGGLLDAAEQVSAGDYGVVDVKSRGPRELRRLTMTFNEMAAQLAANEEQRRRFLADITHELRNPLAVLQSEIEAQLDGVHPRDDDHMSSLLDETRRLGHLVDDLHTLALAETGRLVLQHEAVAFGELVADMAARHDAHAHRQHVTIRCEIDEELPKVWADPTRIRQILDNLLTNAIRHTPPGGDVRVTVSTLPESDGSDGLSVQCRITDTGAGFRTTQLDKVFDRFTRAGDSQGSGLGLSIVRDLVRAHGGTIQAANDPTTGGASVSFTLPT
jgi:two-component system, OmpR family, sensor histidine kinase BaeS